MSFRNFTTGQSHSFGGTYLKLVPGETLVYMGIGHSPQSRRCSNYTVQ